MPSAEPRANGCVFGDLSSTKTVVLYGDSFAEQLIPALSALGSKDHFRVLAYARLGCPFANVTISNWLGTVDQGCATFRKNVIAEIKAMNPKPVLVLLSELLQLNSPTNHAAFIPVASFVNGVTKTLQDLTSTGLMTRVIIGVPQTSGLPATCLAKNLSNVAACALPPSTAYAKVHDAEIKAALTRIGVKTVNLGPLFCNGLCPVIAGNYFVHSDTVHLNAAYATATATGFGTLIGCSAAGYPRAWLTANPIFTTLLPTLSSVTVQAQCQLANSAPLA
ncbi:MAG: SGNH hydrolase domain-containing protein [Actinomycetes bacterium]